MPTKIFVGRISVGTTNEQLRDLFRKFGKVCECDVVSDFGFVHMESEDEAKSAIAALDGYNLSGSKISVELSTARTQGRKRKMVDSSGPGSFRGGRGGGPPGRPAPYPTHREPFDGNMGGGRRYDMPPAPVAPVAPQRREEFASEQVKDLLELYIRDPAAFDQYARSYYYGERAERRLAAAAAAAAPPANFFDGRSAVPDRSYPMSSNYRR